MLVKSALFLIAMLTLASVAALADDAPPTPACTVVGAAPAATPLGPLAQEQADLTISCAGLNEALGRQLADILSRIVGERLDPQAVLAKLGEVNRVPEQGVARTVSEEQKQAMIQSLIGSSEQVAITAHPSVEDSADFARDIAAALIMVGWQIDGHQIRRAAPKGLDTVPGVAIVVHDKSAPPKKALQLRSALNAAHIGAALVGDPAIAPAAALLWVGRRPVFARSEATK